MNLSQTDRLAYYNIFVNMVEMERKFALRKSRKYSFEDVLKDLLVPELDAINCISSAWALDNNKGENLVPTCTKVSSNFRPEDSSEWGKYGLSGISYDHCQIKRGTALDRTVMVCPLLGLEKRNGISMVICSKSTPTRGHTDSCLDQFNDSSPEKGTKLLVDLLDKCKRNGNESEDGMNCRALEDNSRRAIAMYENNCKDASISTDNALRNYMIERCKGIYKAVDQVAKAIDHNINPVNRDVPPKDKSCNVLADAAEESYKPPVGNKSSEAWNYMLDFAVNVCGKSDATHRRAMAAKLGDCSSGLPWKLDAQIKSALVDGQTFADADKLNDPVFAREFADNFGFTPLAMKDLLCGTQASPVNSASDLRTHLDKSLRVKTSESEAALVRKPLLDWQYLQAMGRTPAGMNESQMSLMQDWFEENSREIDLLSDKNDGKKQEYIHDMTPAQLKWADDMIKILKTKNSVADADQQIEMALAKMDKDMTNGTKGEYRSALRAKLISTLLPSQQADRTKRAAIMLNQCKFTANKDAEEREDGSRGPRQANTTGCYYDEMENGVFQFFDERIKEPNKEGAPPYLIARKDKGFCYQPVSDTLLSTKTVGDRTFISGYFQNPENKLKSDSITLNDENFSTSADTGPKEQYILYVYRCTEKEPTLDPAVEKVINGEPTGI